MARMNFEKLNRQERTRKALRQEATGWRKIKAKYSTQCLFCKTKLPKGSRIKWLPGTGVSCTRCQQ